MIKPILKIFFTIFTFVHHRGVAQSGSVLRSGRRGRWFESSRPDSKVTGIIRVPFPFLLFLQ
jgi:hypothetical protein